MQNTNHNVEISIWVDTDAPELLSAMIDDAIYKFLPEVPPKSVEQLVNRYGEASTKTDNSLIRYTIRESGKVIGLMEVVCQPNNIFDIGFKTTPISWGKGYGSIAVSLLINDLQRRFESGKITARFDMRNKASASILTKNGFIFQNALKHFLKMKASTDHVFIRNLNI